jgi:hypothetical protein
MYVCLFLWRALTTPRVDAGALVFPDGMLMPMRVGQNKLGMVLFLFFGLWGIFDHHHHHE